MTTAGLWPAAIILARDTDMKKLSPGTTVTSCCKDAGGAPPSSIKLWKPSLEIELMDALNTTQGATPDSKLPFINLFSNRIATITPPLLHKHYFK
jgi:hypothetical protein